VTIKARRSLFCVLCALVIAVGGCSGEVARSALTIPPQALELRRLQTRRFDTNEETKILEAALGVLQDLGFEVDEAESGLGVIVASKNRDASDTGELVGSFIIGGFTNSTPLYDVEQRIRAAVVTRHITREQISVRVTFQRTVWNNRGEISRNQSLTDPELYREFFFKLSNAVFLQANDI